MPAPGPRGRRGARGPPDVHGVHPLRGDGRGARSRVPARRRHHQHLQQRKLLRKKMWQLIAIVLSAILLFYLAAFYLSVVAWLNAIGHLLKGNFTRAAAWFAVGSGMLFWWMGSDTIPDPMDFDTWLRGSAVIVGLGALLTFIRFCHRHRHQQAAQTDAPSLNINVKFSPSWDIGDCEIRERRSPGENLVAIDRIGRRPPRRRNIGAKQSPRRISGPTIIDQ